MPTLTPEEEQRLAKAIAAHQKNSMSRIKDLLQMFVLLGSVVGGLYMGMKFLFPTQHDIDAAVASVTEAMLETTATMKTIQKEVQRGDKERALLNQRVGRIESDVSELRQ